MIEEEENMKRDKNNIQKANVQRAGVRKTGYGLFAASLVMAAGVFAVMTYMQRMALADFEKRDIYVAAAEIPRGTVIDMDNAGDYMIIKSVDAGCIPADALCDPGDIAGLSPLIDISEGTLLTGSMFASAESVTLGMKSPVLAGFKADDLSKAVSGVLRAGDRIDIYTTDPESGEGKLLCSDVYVERGYDASGNVICDATAAVMFNIYLESSQAEGFYEGLKTGSLYVVRRC